MWHISWVLSLQYCTCHSYIFYLGRINIPNAGKSEMNLTYYKTHKICNYKPHFLIFFFSCMLPPQNWQKAIKALRSSPSDTASLTCWYSCFPKVCLVAARWQSSSNANSASPTALIQWCSLPGPRRPWAISNPLPSPGNHNSVTQKER